MTISGSNLQALVNVLAGTTTVVGLALPASQVCQVPGTITFATASSFVEPTAENKAAFQNLVTRLQITGTLNRLLIVGHTDSPGSPTSNETLSDRRTLSVQAVLRGDTAQWDSLSSTESWGTPEFSAMVVETGEVDPADTAVNRFRGPANRTARLGLFQRYFARLLGGSVVPAILATTPDRLACGEAQLLHGSAGTPSRDTSLPPIEGDFRPNRRVEFFFFASAAPAIAVAEYPKWTGACSLVAPKPTVTVTIAPISTVRVGRTVSVLVTINPSPLPPGIALELMLSTVSGTGEARFAGSGAMTSTIRHSDTVVIRGSTASDTIDNLRLSARIAGETSVLAQEDFTVVQAVALFVKFEIWNLTSRAFEPLPAGVDVDLMDRDPLSDDLIATRQTDAQGRVFFNLPDLLASGETNPDIFFLARTNGRSHAGHTLPAKWSTSGWRAVDGTPGLQTGFTGPQFGSPTAPVVFRVGLDFHARFVYRDLSKTPPADALAPARIPVDVHSVLITPPKRSLFTNNDGEVHGVIFDIDPGDELYFHIEFEMADPSINLPLARVQMSPSGWSTFWADADARPFPNVDRTSFGTQSSPEVFRCTVNDRNVALYFLKVLREWSIFLFHMTGGAWKGVNNLTLFRTSLSGVAYSWPVGEVNIPPKSHWQRSTLVHELSHQIMWQEVNFSSLGIGYEFIFGDLSGYHRANLLANTEHALIEGWAQFMAAVFAGTGTPPYSVTTVVDKSGTSFPLGPPPNNRGESVEGAFANGLWALFEKHIVTTAVAANAHVPESRNGDSTVLAPWLRNTGVRDRFLQIIWRPFQDMHSLANPKTTDMFNFIRTRNPAEWHRLQPELQAFNMAMTAPTIGSIVPAGGPPAGGTAVTISGTEFTLNTTSVRIGGNAASNVVVTSSTSLTASTPTGTLGPADVVVHTAAGDSAPLVGGFNYALPPVISTVTEIGQPPGTLARGPTLGGTPIRIIGTNFLPGAAVQIGGLPAQNVVSLNATEITAQTPRRRFPLPAGGVAVEVRNPDGQAGNLDPGFDYFRLPAPTITGIAPASGPKGGGGTIMVEGANFQSGVELFIGGSAAEINPIATNNTRIIAQLPNLLGPFPPGLVHVDVSVVNADGQIEVIPGGFTYTP